MSEDIFKMSENTYLLKNAKFRMLMESIEKFIIKEKYAYSTISKSLQSENVKAINKWSMYELNYLIEFNNQKYEKLL